MPTSFIEQNDANYSKQLNNFATKLPTYKAVLGFTDAEVAEATADAAFFDYILKAGMEVETFTHNFKAYKIPPVMVVKPAPC